MLAVYTIFYSFCALTMLSAILVIFVTNPVFSALFLVFSFCNVASLLFFLQLEFLPVIFLMVYVGAIAVLFLFVIMMLNIKITELKHEKLNFLPLVLVFLFVFSVELLLFVSCEFNPLIPSSLWHFNFLFDMAALTIQDSNFVIVALTQDNMKLVGQLLFTDFYAYFVIVGFILLLAMIAIIVSTLNKRFVVKSQVIYAQVLRSFNHSNVLNRVIS